MTLYDSRCSVVFILNAKMLRPRESSGIPETAMTQGYMGNMAVSLSGQTGEITFPLDYNKIQTTLIEFQPSGITSEEPKGVVVGDYFFPAILLLSLKEKTPQLLCFAKEWIRTANFDGHSVRLFPDIAQPSGANRLQSVNWCGERLVISRNAERSLFVLVPTLLGKDNWAIAERTSLPEVQGYDLGMLHSVLFGNDSLMTIESTIDLSKWYLVNYELGGGEICVSGEPKSLPPWMYGVGKKPGDEDGLWFVTAATSNQKKASGIYRWKGSGAFPNKPVVSDICGNGICFLEDGSALVSKYGYNVSESGSVTYIPSSLFEG